MTIDKQIEHLMDKISDIGGMSILDTKNHKLHVLLQKKNKLKKIEDINDIPDIFGMINKSIQKHMKKQSKKVKTFQLKHPATKNVLEAMNITSKKLCDMIGEYAAYHKLLQTRFEPIKIMFPEVSKKTLNKICAVAFYYDFWLYSLQKYKKEMEDGINEKRKR